MFHVKHEGWVPARLSDLQRDLLVRYEELLRTVAVPKGMVAASDAGDLWKRHVLDSLRLIPLLPAATARVVDLGSGAGLPGVPLAVADPALDVTLSETRSARIAFLELVVERLELREVHVFPRRAEELPEGGFDLCVARGFGDPRRSWAVAGRLIGPGGCLAYWAGRTFEPADVPPGARLDRIGEPTLESGGPIAIMTRQ
jgi:16S rRNA (guanine527-N7)-methyltransferase